MIRIDAVWLRTYAVFQPTQGADGALARFAVNIAERLDQLGVAPGTGLSDFDEHGASVAQTRHTRTTNDSKRATADIFKFESKISRKSLISFSRSPLRVEK